MDFLRTKIISGTEIYLVEDKINEFIGELDPEQVVSVEFSGSLSATKATPSVPWGSSVLYSALIVYKVDSDEEAEKEKTVRRKIKEMGKYLDDE